MSKHNSPGPVGAGHRDPRDAGSGLGRIWPFSRGRAFCRVIGSTTHRHRTWLVAVAASLLLLGAPGCATVWERQFIGEPVAADESRFDPDSIEIREVPWERVESTLEALHADVVASDSHPDEWPDERQEAARAQLLRGLQVSEDPDRVRILGSARFHTTDALSPIDGSLARHAASIGANRVVYSRVHSGMADRIVSAPVTRFGGASAPYDRDGRSRWTSWENGTAWVPLVVQARETAWTLFWLRLD